MENAKHMAAAFVAVVGRPSAGKSTLVNHLCGYKVSIVSAVPQTTRNTIRGILTEDRGQLVFLDTPGFHESEKKFNHRLTGLVQAAINDADMVLYVVDSTRPLGSEEKIIMDLLATVQVPVVVALNKHDVKIREDGSLDRDEFQRELAERLPQARTWKISALRGHGTEELKKALYELAPDGQAWYPPEYYTDQEPAFRVAEIIREQLMNRTKEEIPHASYVEIEDIELKNGDGTHFGSALYETDPTVRDLPGEEGAEPPVEPVESTEEEEADGALDEGTVGEGAANLSPQEVDLPAMQDLWDLDPGQRPKLWVRALIHVERESQKGIVIGKGGTLIRTIRLEAEKQLREIFPYRIAVDLRVKVSPKWRNTEKIIDYLVH